MKRYAHWERGRRVHGYWCDGHRVGFVGLPATAADLKRIGYSYGVGTRTIARRRTLAAAKRQVERRLACEGYVKEPRGREPAGPDGRSS